MSSIKNLKIISCNNKSDVSSKLRLIISSDNICYGDYNYVDNRSNSIIDDIPSEDFYYLLNQELKKELTKSLIKIKTRYKGKYEKRR